jgi:hypothetical protein
MCVCSKIKKKEIDTKQVMPTLWTKSHSGIEAPVCGLHGAVIEDLTVDSEEDDDFLRDSVMRLREQNPTLHSVPQLDVWAWAQRLFHCKESSQVKSNLFTKKQII